jgi:hypothetical protein
MMRNRRRASGILAVLVILASSHSISSTAQAAPRVELELVAEEGVPPTGSQRWLVALRGVGFSDVRIRQSRPGDRIEVVQRGSDSAPRYLVFGVLTARDTLRLPGGEFRMQDTTGLKQWLAKLHEGGEQRLHETEGAFGLTPTQLVVVHEALSRPVDFDTRGQRSFEAMKRIAGGLSLPFMSDAAARQVMAGPETVADELRGLTAGTALAAILRPLGLVLVPRKAAGGEIKLWIVDVRDTRESWPVGWPLQAAPRETAPKLFNFLNVAIEDTPLTEALDAVGGRLEMPFLFDHNSLARQRIDPAEVKVSVPSGRIYYQNIIDRMLNQAKLNSELRVDEAGTPFLWISTIRR